MAALANAVEGALADHGVVVRSCPLTPDRVRALVRGAEPPVPTAQETTT
jgi:hypothetical protein